MMWVAYFMGAGLVLAYKLARYLWVARGLKKPLKKALIEWFFEPTLENATSWVTTVGVVWMLGFMYISSPANFGLPEHPSVAFTLGSLMEMLSPEVAKRIVTLVSTKIGS